MWRSFFRTKINADGVAILEAVYGLRTRVVTADAHEPYRANLAFLYDYISDGTVVTVNVSRHSIDPPFLRAP